MKRFALLVGALAISASANAQDAEFKNAGEFRVRYENDMNRTGLENGQGQANTNARFKWNLTARKGEKTQAFLSLIHNTTFGAGRNDATGGPAAGNADYTTVGAENSLVVSRAWGWWKASDAVAFKVGRMGIEIADGAVFAEDDYFAFPNTHEGLNVAFDTGFAALNLYLVKQAELTSATATSSDPEQNQYILSADIKNMPEAVKVANVHFVQSQRDSLNDAAAAGAGQGSINAQHLGLTVGGDVGAIMYKGTAAFQFGSADKVTAGDTKLSTNMFDLMVGYSMPETMGLKLSVGYHMDSGDDSADDKNETYQPLFYDSHNYAGLMDIVNWGNLSYFNINASIMPSEETEVGVGYYMFSKTKENGATSMGPGVAAAVTAPAGKKDIGSELDLFVNRSYGTDVKVGARFGMFMPGASIKESTTPNSDKTMMDFMLQASLGF